MKTTTKRIVVYGTLLLLFGALALPNFVKARMHPCANACINNLRQIDGAKEQWALENKKSAGYVPTPEDEVAISGYIKGGRPSCPGGGKYSFNAIDKPPSCDLKDPFGQAHTLETNLPAAASSPKKR